MGLGRRASFSHPSYHMVGGRGGRAGGRGGQLSSFHAFRASLPAPLPKASAQLCCPGEVQASLSHMLQLARVNASSPTLKTVGPPLPAATGSWGRGGRRYSLPADEGWGLISHTCWQGWQSYAPFKRVSSNMLPRSGAGSAFQNSAAGEGQGQLSHSLDPRGAFAACSRWGKG